MSVEDRNGDGLEAISVLVNGDVRNITSCRGEALQRGLGAAEATFLDADRLAHGYTSVRDAQKSFAEPSDAPRRERRTGC